MSVMSVLVLCEYKRVVAVNADCFSAELASTKKSKQAWGQIDFF